MKVLVATEKPFAKVAIDGIRKEIEAAGYELALLEKYTEKQQLLDAVKDANAVIIRSDIIDKEVLDAAKELKIVVRAGAGYDNVDLEAATAHGVCVMNTPGQNSNAVAELAFGMMIMAVRNFYDGKSGTELMGKKLGIHAYGNVGRNVARIAKGIGMDVYAYDAYCPKEAMVADGVKPVDSAEELYATCNVVSLHIPATAETKNSIDYDLVNRMPKNGVLIRILILQGVFVKKKFLRQDDVGSGQRFTLKRQNLFHLHAVGRCRLRHDGLRHRLFHLTACFLPATAKETQEAY